MDMVVVLFSGDNEGSVGIGEWGREHAIDFERGK